MDEKSLPASADQRAAETKWINMVMGVLPGWWLGSDDGRPAEPYISSERWDAELRWAGFAGAGTVAYDGYLNNNIIAVPAEAVEANKHVTLLHHGDSPEGQALEMLTVELRDAGFAVEAHPFGKSLDTLPPNQDIIAALDITRPFFHELKEQELAQFQDLLRQASSKRCGILWITGASQVGCVDPRYAATIGVARVLRNETDIDFATLELEDFPRMGLSFVPTVLAEFQRRRRSGAVQEESVSPEAEWAVVGGKVLAGRYHFVRVPEELKACVSGKQERGSLGAFKKLEQHRAGLASTLFWKEMPEPSLGAGMVKVKVMAVGLNFKVSRNTLLSYALVLFNYRSFGLETDTNQPGRAYLRGSCRRAVCHRKRPGLRVQRCYHGRRSRRVQAPGGRPRHCVLQRIIHYEYGRLGTSLRHRPRHHDIRASCQHAGGVQYGYLLSP